MAVGPHTELLDLTGPTFAELAALHGYDLRLFDTNPASDRPPSWGKVVILQDLLHDYDEVWWIDADAVAVDCSRDIADELQVRDVMAMAAHVTPEGEDPIPNCGVWFLRKCPEVFELLEAAWNSTRYVDHKWWENAAVLNLLGYQLEPKVVLREPAPLWFRTRLLSCEWNSVPIDPSPSPRIMHFAGMTQEERLVEIHRALDGKDRQSASG
jgi:hypothetical protein